MNPRNFETGFEFFANTMGGEVGFASAKVEPVTLVGIVGAELFLCGQLEEGGDDGDFFRWRNAVEDGGVEAVDSGELMAAMRDPQLIANVGHLFPRNREMGGGAIAANSQGSKARGRKVLRDQLVDANVGENVSVVDEKGISRDEGGNVFDASTGFKKLFLVKKMKREPPIFGLGEGSPPLCMEVVGVDRYLRDPCGEEVIKSVGRQGAVKDGHEGLWRRVSKRLQASAQASAE